MRSSERPFRASLPQGSVLSPALFTLSAADLIEELRAVPGTQVFAYADDTVTLSAEATMELARSRAQRAADTLAGWDVTTKFLFNPRSAGVSGRTHRAGGGGVYYPSA